MFDEIWIMLQLSHNFMLQATELVVDGLVGMIKCKLRFERERMIMHARRPFQIPDRGQQLRRGVEVGIQRPGVHWDSNLRNC